MATSSFLYLRAPFVSYKTSAATSWTLESCLTNHPKSAMLTTIGENIFPMVLAYSAPLAAGLASGGDVLCPGILGRLDWKNIPGVFILAPHRARMSRLRRHPRVPSLYPRRPRRLLQAQSVHLPRFTPRRLRISTHMVGLFPPPRCPATSPSRLHPFPKHLRRVGPFVVFAPQSRACFTFVVP